MAQSILSDGWEGVRRDLADVHRQAWQEIAAPGTWLNGAGRVAVAREVRAARACRYCQARKEALSPLVGAGDHDTQSDLGAPAIELIHRLTTDSGRLTRSWQRTIIDGGLSEGDYVEIAGLVSTVNILDTFCLGSGLPLTKLPDPLPGEPTPYVPPGAKDHDAWVRLVAPDDVAAADGPLFPGRDSAVHRALTSVPETKRAYWRVAETHYLPSREMGNLATDVRAISRPQIELIAARVSALHTCFY